MWLGRMLATLYYNRTFLQRTIWEPRHDHVISKTVMRSIIRDCPVVIKSRNLHFKEPVVYTIISEYSDRMIRSSSYLILLLDTRIIEPHLQNTCLRGLFRPGRTQNRPSQLQKLHCRALELLNFVMATLGVIPSKKRATKKLIQLCRLIRTIRLCLNRLPIWNSQNCSMFPLAFVAGWLQGHWWGFISRNYVVWPTFFLMNVFIALKGSHFWFLFVVHTLHKQVFSWRGSIAKKLILWEMRSLADTFFGTCQIYC